MNKFFLFAILGMLFTSCLTEQPRFVLAPPDGGAEAIETRVAFAITDFKDKNLNHDIPEWANRFFEGGVRAVRAMETNIDTYLFITRSEGNNFSALNFWADGFNAELDFPRLAAARVQMRFSAGVHFPDIEFGSLYETLIRTVSDARWTGAEKIDQFWVRRLFLADGESPEREDWEFLILVTIEKTYFTSQLDYIFEHLSSTPPPTEMQRHAFNRVADRFFEGV